MATIRFSGLASGIDSDAIIAALREARSTQKIPLENQITEIGNETDALDEIDSRLLTLRSSLESFLSLSGGAVSKTATSSNTDAITATASNTASTGSITLDVTSLARAATFSFDDRFTEADTPIFPGLGAPDNIDITIGGNTYQVQVDDTTTLLQLASDINEQTNGEVVASVVNTGTEASPQYALLMNGQATGVADGTLSVSVPASITGLGVFQTSTLEQATDAVFDVTGLGTITRSSNQISDLFPGVTFDLKQAATGPVTINIGTDATKTSEKLQEIIAAMNDIITYANENNEVERIESDTSATNLFGSLARTNIDDQAISDLRTALSTAVSDVPDSAVRIFADLGVTTETDGTLTFDEDRFNSAIGSDVTSVEQILTKFADEVATTSGLISQYTRFQGIIDTATDANDDQIESITERIERIDRNLDAEEERLNRVFTNLETTIAELNSQGDAVVAILSGL